MVICGVERRLKICVVRAALRAWGHRVRSCLASFIGTEVQKKHARGSCFIRALDFVLIPAQIWSLKKRHQDGIVLRLS